MNNTAPAAPTQHRRASNTRASVMASYGTTGGKRRSTATASTAVGSGAGRRSTVTSSDHNNNNNSSNSNPRAKLSVTAPALEIGDDDPHTGADGGSADASNEPRRRSSSSASSSKKKSKRSSSSAGKKGSISQAGGGAAKKGKADSSRASVSSASAAGGGGGKRKSSAKRGTTSGGQANSKKKGRTGSVKSGGKSGRASSVSSSSKASKSKTKGSKATSKKGNNKKKSSVSGAGAADAVAAAGKSPRASRGYAVEAPPRERAPTYSGAAAAAGGGSGGGAETASNASSALRRGRLGNGAVNRKNSGASKRRRSGGGSTSGVWGSDAYATLPANLEKLVEAEGPMRSAIEMEEDTERAAFDPVYNVLVMRLLQHTVSVMNARQAAMANTMSQMTEGGGGGGGGSSASSRFGTFSGGGEGGGGVNGSHANSDGGGDPLTAAMTEVRVLQRQLEASTLESEKRGSELEVLRTQLARQLAGADAAREEERRRVQAALDAATLDVTQMRVQLARRVDVACSAIRTPQYETALRSLQEAAAAAAAEVQAHHDALTRLIISIGAKETLARDPSGTMHSNFPAAYRQQLRRLHRDRLLNILDVLSFQEGVVDTVGRALYALEEGEYQPDVVGGL